MQVLSNSQAGELQLLLISVINCCKRMIGKECIYGSGQFGHSEIYMWGSVPGEELGLLDDAILDFERLMGKMGLRDLSWFWALLLSWRGWELCIYVL